MAVGKNHINTTIFQLSETNIFQRSDLLWVTISDFKNISSDAWNLNFSSFPLSYLRYGKSFCKPSITIGVIAVSICTANGEEGGPKKATFFVFSAHKVYYDSYQQAGTITKCLRSIFRSILPRFYTFGPFS